MIQAIVHTDILKTDIGEGVTYNEGSMILFSATHSYLSIDLM